MPREIDDPLLVKAFEAEERKRQKPATRELTDPMLVKAFEAKEAAGPTFGELGKDVGKQVAAGLGRGAVEIPLAIPRLASLAANYIAPESEFARSRQAWIDKTQESMGRLGLTPEAETAAGRYAGAVAEAVPGFAMPGVGFGGQIARGVATGVPGQVSRFRPIAQTIGGSLGAGVAGQAAEDLGADPITRGLASVAGGFGGALGAPRAAATLADVWFNQAGNVPLGPRAFVPTVPGVAPGSGANPFIRAQRAPGSAGGPAGPPTPTPGSTLGPIDAAAYDALHRAMVQAGVPPERIPQVIDDYAKARLARGSLNEPRGRSLAAGELALMDIDPALQSLAGSISRMSPEGANVIRPVITARQTGKPVPGLDPDMGVSTRARGTRVEDIPEGQFRPAGQDERIDDLLGRMLEIHDMPYHGHGRNVAETTAATVAAQQTAAKMHWGAVESAGSKVNVGADKGVQAAVQRWVDRMNTAGVSAKERGLIKSMLDQYAPEGADGVRRVAANINDFHLGKQFADDIVGNFYTGGGPDSGPTLGRIATTIKKDIVGAVDSIKKNGLGVKYREARAKFAGPEQAQREMAKGEQIWAGKLDAKATLDPLWDAEREARSRVAVARKAKDKEAAAAALAEARELRASIKRIKHGYRSAAVEEASGKDLASDKTRMFNTRERERQLSYMIERTETETGKPKASGTFSDRPQRFFSALEQGEDRFIQSRNVIQGGSPTQERAIRDQLFDTLHTARDILTGGPTVAIQRGAELLFEKFFGMSADVNVALAKKLASTNPDIHKEAYRELSMRVGRTRADIFKQVMEQHRRTVAASAAGAAPSVSEGQ